MYDRRRQVERVHRKRSVIGGRDECDADPSRGTGSDCIANWRRGGLTPGELGPKSTVKMSEYVREWLGNRAQRLREVRRVKGKVVG